MSTTTTPSSESTSTTDTMSTRLPLKTRRFVFERYPKTALEELQSVLNDQTTTNKFDLLSPRSRQHHPHSHQHLLQQEQQQQQQSQRQQRFRTQPVTLTEINETDEENKLESDYSDDSSSLSSTGRTVESFQRLEHLALSDHIRRTARKKAPLKNYLERQRLKAMREEPSETDGN